jgi:tyrosinase
MVDRFVSGPIDLPGAAAQGEGDGPSRADLVFYDVDHSGVSYEARIFINAPDADASTPRDDPHYAGSYCIFGHGGCFGDIGHCDVPTGPRDPFDLRPSHQLIPAAKTVIVTEAFKRLVAPEDETMTVTVVAFVPGAEQHDVLQFDTIRLLTYE